MTDHSSDDLDILDLDDLLNDDNTESEDSSDLKEEETDDDGFQYESLDSDVPQEHHGTSQQEVYSEQPAAARTRRRADTVHSVRKGEQKKEQKEKKTGRPVWIHIVLLIAIAAVAVVTVVRFLIWNQGIDISSLGIDPEANKNRYNVEVNDSMIYLTDDQLAGHEDDGVTTILCLGDDPFSQDRTEAGLSGQIAALGGSNVSVINAAFPSSQVTCENTTYQTDSIEDMDDIFNLFYVSYAISIGDFSSLETVASVHDDDSAYSEAVQALENTDFNSVDMIAIMYDASDYINGAAMQNPDNPDELTTYVGSLSNSFKLLQQKYPWIRIVFMSPYYAEYDGESGRTTDHGNGTITNYFQWAYDTCSDSNVSFLDNYYGSVNENNYQEYTSDGVHLNSEGCTKIADHFVWKVLEGNYDEYNVEEMAVAK